MYIIKQFAISRISCNGQWQRIFLRVYTDSSYTRSFVDHNRGPGDPRDELTVIYQILNVITDNPSIRSQVLQGFDRLRENDLSGNSRQSTRITVVPEAHHSCKQNNDNEATLQTSEENELSQSEIKQKLAIVNKVSKAMKFFDDNKCSVCLCSYKEILYDNLHIVFPSCGHPLCCKCADNILRSEKKECPCCRGNITTDSYNQMKFNVDLEMINQDQRVFLN